jgi:hypothetical protein
VTAAKTRTTVEPGGTAELFSAVYASVATREFSRDQLDDLLRQSRRNNDASDVTGMLLYREGRFIQVLEGPEKTVRNLLAVIKADTRHEKVRVLLEEHLTERTFADWTMEYEPIRVPSSPLAPGFRDSFDDLESDDDQTTTRRAIRELTLWFRVRAASGS